MRVIAVIALFLAAAANSSALAQPGSRDSYQYLSDRGKELFDGLADANGQPDDAERYNQQEESKRSTFEAIMHVLESLGLDHLVQSVDAIWGAAASQDGLDQYRVSVTFVDRAVRQLRAQTDFQFYRFGHVKLPDGTVIGRLDHPFALIAAVARTDSVRQRRPAFGEAASMQISWLEDRPTTGEVDIDYRKPGDLAHSYSTNSDVRFQMSGISHYRLHEQTYGAGLINWWRP